MRNGARVGVAVASDGPGAISLGPAMRGVRVGRAFGAEHAVRIAVNTVTANILDVRTLWLDRADEDAVIART